MEQNFVSKEQLEEMVSKLDAISWLQNIIPAEHHALAINVAKGIAALVAVGGVTYVGYAIGNNQAAKARRAIGCLIDSLLKEAKEVKSEIKYLNDTWFAFFRDSRKESCKTKFSELKETLSKLKETGVFSESQTKTYEELFK